MRFKSYWPLVGWSLVILVLSWIPGNYIPGMITFRDWIGPDKLAHLFMYGVFSFLFLWAFVRHYNDKKSRLKVIVLALFVGTIFGILTEWLQRLPIIGRNGNLFDFGADVLGLIIGIFAFHIFYRRKIEAVKKY